MKKILPALLGLYLFFGSVTAWASSPCYGLEEMKAEQLLRLHSKLMVVTVSCRYNSRGESLTPAYTAFTQKNLSDLHDAEQTLISFYKKNYGGDAVSRLDKLRTLLGNEYGQKIADVSAPVFCEQNRDSVVSALQAQREEVMGEAEATSISAHSYAPVCSGQKPSHAKG